MAKGLLQVTELGCYLAEFVQPGHLRGAGTSSGTPWPRRADGAGPLLVIDGRCEAPRLLLAAR